MSDRVFLYLDPTRVKRQLDQLEQPKRDVTGRENIAREDGAEVGIKVPGGSLDGRGGHKRWTESERQWLDEDTSERMFARYHGYIHKTMLSEVPSDVLDAGGRYELRGTLVRPGVFRTDAGLEIELELDDQCWLGGSDRTAIPIVLFGVGMRSNSLLVLAMYLPPAAPPPPPSPPPSGKLRRRRILIGIGVGITAAGGSGLLVWNTARDPEPTRYRIAGGPGEFLSDDRVKGIFRSAGLAIDHTVFGTGELETIDLSKYDGVFPASAVMARNIQRRVGNRPQYPSYSSPMVVVSWPTVIDQLVEVGIASKVDGFWVFDVLRYIEQVNVRTRWPRDPGNRRLLLRTTDPRTSNSAAMFLATAAYALNGSSAVTDQQMVTKLLPKIKPCFEDQGDKPLTTGHLRRAYLEGPGTVPMAWGYEDDAVEDMLEGKDVTILYPRPNVVSEHMFIPTSDHPDGARVGQMLRHDRQLMDIAQRHFGFRYGGEGGNRDFSGLLGGKGITVPSESVLSKFGRGEVASVDILGSFVDVIQPQLKSPA